MSFLIVSDADNAVHVIDVFRCSVINDRWLIWFRSYFWSLKISSQNNPQFFFAPDVIYSPRMSLDQCAKSSLQGADLDCVATFEC